jgi:hypothetical protein
LSSKAHFLRIPTRWSIGLDTPRNQLLVVPEVSQDIDSQTASIDGWGLRDRFFRLGFDEPDEPSVLRFLNDVGVWAAISEPRVSKASAGKTLLGGAFGSRSFIGRTFPLLLTDLKHEQDFWRRLLTDRVALRARFGTAPGPGTSPAKRAEFALESQHYNEMPLRIEWRSGMPTGVVETITGREMLIATIHLDLLRGARFQVCKRPDCSIPFSIEARHRRKYCTWYCGHIESVRKARKGEKQQHSTKKGDD